MTKEGEGVAGATGSLQDLAVYVIKTYRYIRRGLGRDEFKSGKHGPTMSRKRGDVQRDG